MNLNVSTQSSQGGSAATEALTTDLPRGIGEGRFGLLTKACIIPRGKRMARMKTLTGVDQAYRVRRSLAAVGHVSSPGGHS